MQKILAKFRGHINDIQIIKKSKERNFDAKNFDATNLMQNNWRKKLKFNK